MSDDLRNAGLIADKLEDDHEAKFVQRMAARIEELEAVFSETERGEMQEEINRCHDVIYSEKGHISQRLKDTEKRAEAAESRIEKLERELEKEILAANQASSSEHEYWELLREAETALEQAQAREKGLENVITDLGLTVLHYQRAHDLHGDGSLEAGRAWDRMRRAREAAEVALAALEEHDG